MSFTLKEATIEDIKERFDVLESKKPLSIMTLLTLKNFVKYPILFKNVFVSKDPAYSSLIVINLSTTGTPPSLNIYWDPEELEDNILKVFLKSVPCWNWCEPFITICILEPLCSKFIRIISDTELSGSTLEPQPEGGGVMMQITKETLNKFDLLDQYKMDRLHPWHIPYVFSIWDYSKEHNEEQFSKNMEFLPSVAIFKKEDDIKTSNPVAFMLQYEIGMLGLTFTAEEHRRKGLGAFVESKLAETILDQGELAIIWIVAGPSVCKFHEKVGYRHVLKGGGWVFFLEKGETIDEYMAKFNN